MYPREQLEALDRLKSIVRTRISRQRAEAVRHAAGATRPLDLLSRVHAKWQALPLGIRMAMGPLALTLQRAIWKRFRVGGAAVLWGPVIWRLAKWVIPLIKASSFFTPGPDAKKERRLRTLRRRARVLRREAGES